MTTTFKTWKINGESLRFFQLKQESSHALETHLFVASGKADRSEEI